MSEYKAGQGGLISGSVSSTGENLVCSAEVIAPLDKLKKYIDDLPSIKEHNTDDGRSILEPLDRLAMMKNRVSNMQEYIIPYKQIEAFKDSEQPKD